MTQAHSGFTLPLKEILLKQAANYNSKLKGFCQEICQNSNGKNSHQSNFSIFSSYDIFLIQPRLVCVELYANEEKCKQWRQQRFAYKLKHWLSTLKPSVGQKICNWHSPSETTSIPHSLSFRCLTRPPLRPVAVHSRKFESRTRYKITTQKYFIILVK